MQGFWARYEKQKVTRKRYKHAKTMVPGEGFDSRANNSRVSKYNCTLCIIDRVDWLNGKGRTTARFLSEHGSQTTSVNCVGV